MSGITIVRIPAKMPGVHGELSDTFWRDVGEVAQGDLLNNIVEQKQGDGTPLKRNAPSTLARKRREGRGSRSLVDRQHRFVQGASKSWRTRILPRGAGVVIEAATAELAKLNAYVRAKGYVGWEKLSKEAWSAIKAALVRELRRKEAGVK